MVRFYHPAVYVAAWIRRLTITACVHAMICQTEIGSLSCNWLVSDITLHMLMQEATAIAHVELSKCKVCDAGNANVVDKSTPQHSSRVTFLGLQNLMIIKTIVA